VDYAHTRFYHLAVEAELEFGFDEVNHASKLTLYQDGNVTSGSRR